MPHVSDVSYRPLLLDVISLVNNADGHLFECWHMLARMVSTKEKLTRCQFNTNVGLRATSVTTVSGGQDRCFKYCVHTMIKAQT